MEFAEASVPSSQQSNDTNDVTLGHSRLWWELLPHETLRVSNGSCKASDILRLSTIHWPETWPPRDLDGPKGQLSTIQKNGDTKTPRKSIRNASFWQKWWVLGTPKSFPSKALHLTSLPISSTAAWHNLTRRMLQFNSHMTSDELHWDMTSDTFRPFLNGVGYHQSYSILFAETWCQQQERTTNNLYG